MISAYACEPNRGAEPGVGWNIVRELSHHHELWVLTRADNQAAIEAFEGEWAEKVHWHYVDPPSWVTRWKHGTRILRLFYVIWQRSALNEARKIAEEVEFDIVHHLTFGTYLVPSLLGSLGVPLVIGPVGGGETSPPLLKNSYSWPGKLSEFGRDFMRSLVQMWPPFRRRLIDGSVVLAATEQTRAVLQILGLKDVKLVPQSGIGDDEVDAFVSDHPIVSKPPMLPDEPLKLVSASRLIHWKAIDLAIEAIALVKKQGIKVQLRVLQNGREKARLEQLVGDLGLKDEVSFEGLLPTLEDVYQAISESDGLIHPALHEVFGQACVESLALGVPVICIDWCGPGMIVNEKTGFKVTPGDREATLEELAEAIIALRASRVSGEDFATACRARALESFHWKRITDEILASYLEAVEKRQSRN
ncbi:MAG: glycosyltransferase [Akkermansiaceae bacterium]